MIKISNKWKIQSGPNLGMDPVGPTRISPPFVNGFESNL